MVWFILWFYVRLRDNYACYGSLWKIVQELFYISTVIFTLQMINKLQIWDMCKEFDEYSANKYTLTTIIILEKRWGVQILKRNSDTELLLNAYSEGYTWALVFILFYIQEAGTTCYRNGSKFLWNCPASRPRWYRILYFDWYSKCDYSLEHTSSLHEQGRRSCTILKHILLK
jgi:hypothetical protein